MTAFFETAGEQPRWQAIFHLATGKPVGEMLTYEQLDDAIGADFRAHRDGLYKAIRVLEQAERRTLVCVANVGYRVAAATEHESLARGRQRRSRRQIERAVSIASNVRRDELDPEQARRMEGYEMTLRSHADMLRRMGARVDRQEASLRDVRRRTSQTVAEQNERIERLEALMERTGITAS